MNSITHSDRLESQSRAGAILIDCLLITLAIFIPYHQVAQHTFTDFDDGAYIFQNRHIIAGLNWDNLVWAFTTTELANWHPLTWISLLIDRELFAAHPGGYLLMNVAWHSLAASLCYIAFLKCTTSRVFALSIALIFALHPVNVENVAWASERKSILNAVFWFASIISYLEFIKTKTFKAYGLTVIFFILSLFSKAMSVTLPCTLGLIHCLHRIYHPELKNSLIKKERYWSQIIWPISPLLVLAIYFSVVTTAAQSISMSVDLPLATRLLNAILSYERYLVMFFHPTALAVFYPLKPDCYPTYLTAIPSFCILLALSGIVLVLTRRLPQLLIGWCWFLGTMVPVIGLVQIGGQSHADRYLYIPMLGLAFIFPVLFEQLRTLPSWVKSIVISSSLTITALSMILASQIQVSYWKDGETLCRHALGITGYSFHAVQSLSLTYTRTGQFDKFFSLIDSTIATENNAYVSGILTTMKANVLYTKGNHTAAQKAALAAIDFGFANKASYTLAALSSFELGQFVQAGHYLAKAKTALTPRNPNTILSFSLDPKLAWLEIQLHENVPSEFKAKASMQPSE